MWSCISARSRSHQGHRRNLIRKYKISVGPDEKISSIFFSLLLNGAHRSRFFYGCDRKTHSALLSVDCCNFLFPLIKANFPFSLSFAPSARLGPAQRFNDSRGADLESRNYRRSAQCHCLVRLNHPHSLNLPALVGDKMMKNSFFVHRKCKRTEIRLEKVPKEVKSENTKRRKKLKLFQVEDASPKSFAPLNELFSFPFLPRRRPEFPPKRVCVFSVGCRATN